MLSSLNSQPPVATITSDDSGSWGCRAVCGQDWFQLSWDCKLEHSHISVKELTPIIIAVALWGKKWQGKCTLGLDLDTVDQDVEHYFSRGLATTTHKTYQAGQRYYLEFCEQVTVSPLPASESTLCQFVTVLANNGIAHSTVKVYLSATRQLHIAKGLPEPRTEKMPRLSQVLKGIRTTQPTKSRFTRLLITPGILLQIKEGWEKEPLVLDKTILWASMLLCFSDFFSQGRYICAPPPGSFNDRDHLTFADVIVDNPANPQQLHILLKRLKTDQAGKGTLVGVGRTGDQLCPVAAILSWMVRRFDAPEPLSHFRDGALLTQQRFVVELRKALQMIGEDPQQFGGHSFRAGAATTAAQQGISDANN